MYNLANHSLDRRVFYFRWRCRDRFGSASAPLERLWDPTLHRKESRQVDIGQKLCHIVGVNIFAFVFSKSRSFVASFISLQLDSWLLKLQCVNLLCCHCFLCFSKRAKLLTKMVSVVDFLALLDTLKAPKIA